MFSSVLRWESSGSPNTSKQSIPFENAPKCRVLAEQGRVKPRHLLPLTLILVWRQSRPCMVLLTSHPPTLRSLLDTSSESLFCISLRSVLRSVFCRLSSSLSGPDLDRCRRFSERAGNFHHFTPSESVQLGTWVALATVGLWVGYSQVLRGDSPP